MQTHFLSRPKTQNVGLYSIRKHNQMYRKALLPQWNRNPTNPIQQTEEHGMATMLSPTLWELTPTWCWPSTKRCKFSNPVGFCYWAPKHLHVASSCKMTSCQKVAETWLSLYELQIIQHHYFFLEWVALSRVKCYSNELSPNLPISLTSAVFCFCFCFLNSKTLNAFQTQLLPTVAHWDLREGVFRASTVHLEILT